MIDSAQLQIYTEIMIHVVIKARQDNKIGWRQTRLAEHKRATRNGDVSVNNHIAENHQLTNHTMVDWDSAQCVTCSTNYFQRLTLESWFTNLEQTPLNRCQQLPAPYKRLIQDTKITNEPNRTT